MSFSVISKSNSTISGTPEKNIKVAGDSNNLEIKDNNKDIWVSGDKNKGSIKNDDEGRVAVTGDNNNLDVENGSLLIKGTGNKATFKGGDNDDVVTLRGTNNKLTSAAFGDGNDRLTSISGKLDTISMGSGNDFVGIKNNKDAFNIGGGAGTDTLWLDKIDSLNNGSTANGFEKLYLQNFNDNYKVEKNSDGKYVIKNGSNLLNFGSNGDALIWNGKEYKKASELAGAVTGGGTGLEIKGTNNDDLFDDDKLKGDLKGAVVDGKFGKDTFIVDGSLKNTTLTGGADEDILKTALGVDDYDNIAFADGKFTFKKGDNTFNAKDDIEKFQFGNKTFTLDELKAHLTPYATTSNADGLTVSGAASKYKKAVNAQGGDDTITLAADATGYTIDGGDGTGDELDLRKISFDKLKQATWSGSGSGISNLNILGNTISNFEKFNAEGLKNTAGTEGSVFQSLQALIEWLTK